MWQDYTGTTLVAYSSDVFIKHIKCDIKLAFAVIRNHNAFNDKCVASSINLKSLRRVKTFCPHVIVDQLLHCLIQRLNVKIGVSINIALITLVPSHCCVC